MEVGKTYHWCSCGLSQNQPWCDGSHQGSPYKPVSFVAESKLNKMCMCKHSGNKPYCDGTHMSLDFWSNGNQQYHKLSSFQSNDWFLS